MQSEVESLIESDWRQLAPRAAALRDAGWGRHVTYSRKVFVPLTRLCRDVCHYCTFAAPPRRLEQAFLSIEAVLEIARAGAAAGCKEVLFTLGDKPELRYGAARDGLAALGAASTLDYLETAARHVLEETGLLPHLNPGLLTLDDYRRLRGVAPSMGIMLETAAARLGARGGPHFGSPDKVPARRLASIAAAGEARVPLTTGILIGIGETRAERLEAILAIRDLNRQYGHIQEIIVQNFRAKPGTRMALAPEPDIDELCWTIAAARHLLGAETSIQAPPNLFRGNLVALIEAGINDWGGVSPVTPDHVNPEAPWPHLKTLARSTEAAGYELVERLTVYPRFVEDRARWVDPGLHRAVLRLADGAGRARPGVWASGSTVPPSADDLTTIDIETAPIIGSEIYRLATKAADGASLDEAAIAALFDARGRDFEAVRSIADALRREISGDGVTYVVNRNINYTNICLYKCGFCAFSKGKTAETLRGKPYYVALSEIARRVEEAASRGATEVCLQGGIHPSFTGETYLAILATAKAAVPGIHVHAFSPLEVTHGAATLGLQIPEYLARLKAGGLGSLPGTAAEILDDEIRRIICADKLDTAAWTRTVGAAHRLDLPTTATVMFGHVEGYRHWARHLLRISAIQQETGGFTEFVPLPFVHMEAPLYIAPGTRKGPSLREAVLMHALARLVLSPANRGGIRNIQVSWTKMGPALAARCLDAGANDLGGTLMNESISRAAGASHGEEMPPEAIAALAQSIGREAVQRTTLYRPVEPAQSARARAAAPLSPPIFARPAGRTLAFS